MEYNRYIVKAKMLKTGKWVTGYYYKMAETTHCVIDDCPPVPFHHYILQESMTDWELPNQMLRYEVDPETICICTGLSDKNGKSIFEGDIVKDKFDVVFKIFWEDKKYRFAYEATMNSVLLQGLRWTLNQLEENEIEVVGNIFDNPELLKGRID